MGPPAAGNRLSPVGGDAVGGGCVQSTKATSSPLVPLLLPLPPHPGVPHTSTHRHTPTSASLKVTVTPSLPGATTGSPSLPGCVSWDLCLPRDLPPLHVPCPCLLRCPQPPAAYMCTPPHSTHHPDFGAPSQRFRHWGMVLPPPPAPHEAGAAALALVVIPRLLGECVGGQAIGNHTQGSTTEHFWWPEQESSGQAKPAPPPAHRIAPKVPPLPRRGGR